MEILIAALVALLGLMHLAYAVQNLLNLDPAHDAVAAVLGQAAMGDAYRNGMFAGLVMLILLFLPTV